MSLNDKREYCDRHGYDFFTINETVSGRDVAWAKLPGLLSLLGRYDWVVSLDLDSLIFDHGVRLEEFLDPSHDFIVGLDENGVNSGVFFLRNSTWSKALLVQAWTMTSEPMSHIWWEQSAFMSLFKHEGVRNHVKYSPQTQFNSYIASESAVHMHENGGRGPFIVHFAGIGRKWELLPKFHAMRRRAGGGAKSRGAQARDDNNTKAVDETGETSRRQRHQRKDGDTRERGSGLPRDGHPVVRALPSTQAGDSSSSGMGRHAVEYIKLANAARSTMAGSVSYEAVKADSTRVGSAPGAGHHGPPHRSRPLRIAQYSHVYGPSPLWSSNFTGCDRPCQAVGGAYGNVTTAADADVVVINLMQPGVPWHRPPGQVWVGTYFESPDHYPALRQPDILSQFNYTTGYRPDADFPNFHMVLDTAKFINQTLAWPLPAYETKVRQPMMSTWISNCHVDTLGRLPLLHELERHNVTIVSYGTCGPNQTTPRANPDMDARWRQWVAAGGSGLKKAAVSAQHLFMYAAENSGCAYYTTEKVFHGLIAGSVPVYLGDAAPLKRLVPASSVIYASDFGSPGALAAHLHFLASNQTAYESYLTWRSHSSSLDALARVMALPAWEVEHGEDLACAVCEFLWAAPRRTNSRPVTDLCKPIGSRKTRFRMRLM